MPPKKRKYAHKVSDRTVGSYVEIVQKEYQYTFTEILCRFLSSHIDRDSANLVVQFQSVDGQYLVSGKYSVERVKCFSGFKKYKPETIVNSVDNWCSYFINTEKKEVQVNVGQSMDIGSSLMTSVGDDHLYWKPKTKDKKILVMYCMKKRGLKFGFISDDVILVYHNDNAEIYLLDITLSKPRESDYDDTYYYDVDLRRKIKIPMDEEIHDVYFDQENEICWNMTFQGLLISVQLDVNNIPIISTYSLPIENVQKIIGTWSQNHVLVADDNGVIYLITLHDKCKPEYQILSVFTGETIYGQSCAAPLDYSVATYIETTVQVYRRNYPPVYKRIELK